MRIVFVFFLLFLFTACQVKRISEQEQNAGKSGDSAKQAERLLNSVRQVTHVGRRSGEGYFNLDGSKMVFQSERDKGNPFYQIYLMDMATGKTQQISPGQGKTTCSWIHPSKNEIMYSSTHLDPRSRDLQKEEEEFRTSGKKRAYSWSYDPNYDIFVSSFQGKLLKRLTNAKGYDAEGSYSSDGKSIAFASNRHAYADDVSDEVKVQREKDPSRFLDIYIMTSEGRNVTRLTTSDGYDGGPFFSRDNKKITWRRFSEDGRTAEVYTMNVDGSDQKQITKLNAMSWAPYFHPSGDYLIFTTSVHGKHNFELYVVDAEGKSAPIRVTDLEGFDGLPVFTPDGQSVAWTHHNAKGESQIYMGKWDDLYARQLLNLPVPAPEILTSKPEIREVDMKNYVYYLASEKLKGRMTGSAEEKEYMRVVADFFRDVAIEPAGDTRDSYFQTFDFVDKVELGGTNVVKVDGKDLRLNKDFLPLSFSKSGSVAASELVFAGYGIRAPATENFKEYDSYEGLDVQDKWVVVFRYVPEDIDPKLHMHLSMYSRLQFKATTAKNQGAKGLIVISGPNSKVKNQLTKFRYEGANTDASIPVISVTDAVAEAWFQAAEKSMKKVQTTLDGGDFYQGFAIPEAKVAAHIEIKQIRGEAANTLGLLRVPGARKTLIIGAHGDHLGLGGRGTSMRRNSDEEKIHFGADDNASGVAGILELAHYFSQPEVKQRLKQNILFVVWSGEEIGILGSNYFAKQIKNPAQYSAYLNMDMIGRLREKLQVQATGSSTVWPYILEELALQAPVTFSTQSDPYVPSDSMALYLAKIPTLMFFTGSHLEYHTPRDTPDTLNYPGMEKVVRFVRDVASKVAVENRDIPYQEVESNRQKSGRGFRIFLGTIPDYTQEGAKGVVLSGVVKNGPAEKAGLREKDKIIEFAQRKIEGLMDYVYALQTLKPGVEVPIKVVRDGQEVTLTVIPQSKD